MLVALLLQLVTGLHAYKVTCQVVVLELDTTTLQFLLYQVTIQQVLLRVIISMS